ncbi:hypothetical protein FB471_4904 [Amycolatopsis cihanbeyliensis]|uniref:Uncharacterized protein n=1 Tax=Amycolatopsis cihanbeyliensis TaxID=1128664 RepID=A0A542DPQ1_AMYCI|nr:hypothetical protein FB471_4904 [Amycolatopsis cihanbeyliensis]
MQVIDTNKSRRGRAATSSVVHPLPLLAPRSYRRIVAGRARRATPFRGDTGPSVATGTLLRHHRRGVEHPPRRDTRGRRRPRRRRHSGRGPNAASGAPGDTDRRRTGSCPTWHATTAHDATSPDRCLRRRGAIHDLLRTTPKPRRLENAARSPRSSAPHRTPLRAQPRGRTPAVPLVLVPLVPPSAHPHMRRHANVSPPYSVHGTTEPSPHLFRAVLRPRVRTVAYRGSSAVSMTYAGPRAASADRSNNGPVSISRPMRTVRRQSAYGAVVRRECGVGTDALATGSGIVRW